MRNILALESTDRTQTASPISPHCSKIFVGSGEKAAHLRDAGAVADATVLTLTESHHRSGRHGHSHSHSYDVGYSFQVGSRTYTATDPISRDLFGSLAEGDRIPVHYWTEDPSQSKIDIGDAISNRRIGLARAIATSSAVLVHGSLAWRDAGQARWVATHGQRNQVEITGHAKTSVTVNGFPFRRAVWGGRYGAGGMGRAE